MCIGKPASIKNPDWRNTLETKPGLFSDLEVGDWVELKTMHDTIQAFVADIEDGETIRLKRLKDTGDTEDVGRYYMDGKSWGKNELAFIIRKIDPREIRIKFGVLEGTVEYNEISPGSSFFLRKINGCNSSMIDNGMIPEKLLKALNVIFHMQKIEKEKEEEEYNEQEKE